MQYGAFVCQNNSIVASSDAFVGTGNRSFRYGDGCFETLKMVGGSIPLWSLHMERLWRTVTLLQFQWPKHFTANQLHEQVLKLVRKNKHEKLARIRITIYAGNGGVFEFTPRVPYLLIESWELPQTQNQWQENGLDIAVYPHAAKSVDVFSALKTNNYLPYVMAAIWAKELQLNDAIVQNCNGNWADTTITNLAIITRNMEVVTVTPNCGAVNGVMQNYLQNQAVKSGISWVQKPLNTEVLSQASELFLMNSIHGIKWVKHCETSSFTGSEAYQLYQKFIYPLWNVG